MSKSSIVILIYIVGLLFGALFLGLWSNNTGIKSLLALIWTAIFLVSIFYAEK
tara:strand:- start:212 stop:370 length:159 start_codon:yes stop_codon:yes gene_type:complete